MTRPKSKVVRKTLSTTIKVDILDKLKEVTKFKEILINRLIEISLEK